MVKPPATILAPTKDYCLHCESHKYIKTSVSLNNRIGYICEECYTSNIWATTKLEVELVHSLRLKDNYENQEDDHS